MEKKKMTIGLFTSSVLGMNAQSHSMSQISTNIANVNTVGYKRAETQFKTILAKEYLGTNFLGVNTSDRRFVSSQGTFLSSAGQYDLALKGDGFFVVSTAVNDGEQLYTRAGNFKAIAVTQSDGSTENYLGTDGGQFVLGWLADDNGNFSYGSIEPVKISAETAISGIATTTLGITGNIPVSDVGEQRDTSFSIYDSNFNTKNVRIVFERQSLSNEWLVKFTTEDGTVTAPPPPQTAEDPDGVTVRFDANGRMVEPASTVNLQISWNDGAASSNIAVDLSKITQMGSEKVIDSIEQNGRDEGELLSTSFNSEGVLSGAYTNGQVVPICKLAQVNFTVPDNLEAVSSNMFRATDGAGEMIIKDGVNVGASQLLVNTIEGSNVDLGDQFSKMIVTQKAYSSAATAFRTTDEMLQEASSIKR